jgi:RimJ/RimL family protein N-acetyltransferase
MTALELRTDRLELRPLTAVDLEAAHALWIDPGVRRYLWDDVVIPVETAREVLARSTTDFETRAFGLWGLYEPGASGLIGFCGCRSTPDDGPELMFGLLPPWWRQGLVAEAATAVLTYLFTTLRLAQVVAATDVPNVASARVLERLGFVRTGQRLVHGLDTAFYRLRQPAWSARQRDVFRSTLRP